jgi:hypothetical protein
MLEKALITFAAAVASAFFFATPVNADPGENPCELAISFLCRFVPLAPDLDHDIDVTQGQQVGPNAPPAESLPVVDPCAAGCI